jgi:hypothetical protein
VGGALAIDGNSEVSMRLKLVVPGLLLAGFAVILSGCVVFKTPVTGERVSKRKVEVKFKVCESDVSDESGRCGKRGNANEGTTEDPGRVLIGFRVPKGTGTPPQIRSSDGFPIVLKKVISYKRQLNGKAPKHNNQKWYGYRSDVLIGSGDTGGGEATFKVKFKIPKGYDRRNFKVRPVIGVQATDLESPVQCGPDVFDGRNNTGANSQCIDSPAPDQMKNARIPLKKG